jgi:hypothetical protein
VFQRLATKINDRFVNIKFSSDNCAVFSEAMKKSSVYECHKRFKEGSRGAITDEGNPHHFL